jgi:hypothetical protein
MGLLLLPLGIFAGWVAGAAMSRRMVRSEVQRLESLIENKNGKAAAVPEAAPVAALVLPPVPSPYLRNLKRWKRSAPKRSWS